LRWVSMIVWQFVSKNIIYCLQSSIEIGGLFNTQCEIRVFIWWKWCILISEYETHSLEAFILKAFFFLQTEHPRRTHHSRHIYLLRAYYFSDKKFQLTICVPARHIACQLDCSNCTLCTCRLIIRLSLPLTYIMS